MLKDQRDLLFAFNEHRVRYLLVGGYALVQYTEPRVMKDIDLWVEITAENSERVYKALAASVPHSPDTLQETFKTPTPDFK